MSTAEVSPSPSTRVASAIRGPERGVKFWTSLTCVPSKRTVVGPSVAITSSSPRATAVLSPFTGWRWITIHPGLRGSRSRAMTS